MRAGDRSCSRTFRSISLDGW